MGRLVAGLVHIQQQLREQQKLHQEEPEEVVEQEPLDLLAVLRGAKVHLEDDLLLEQGSIAGDLEETYHLDQRLSWYFAMFVCLYESPPRPVSVLSYPRF